MDLIVNAKSSRGAVAVSFLRTSMNLGMAASATVLLIEDETLVHVLEYSVFTILVRGVVVMVHVEDRCFLCNH